MNLDTIKNCYKIWSKMLPEPPTEEQIRDWSIEQLTDNLHTNYMSYLLIFDKGTVEDKRFEKAYQHLHFLTREFVKKKDNKNQEDLADETVKQRLDSLENKFSKNHFYYHPPSYHSPSYHPPSYQTYWNNSYSPMTDYKDESYHWNPLRYA